MKRFRSLSRNYGSSSRQDFWFFANCENIVAIWFCTETLIFVLTCSTIWGLIYETCIDEKSVFHI